MRNMNDLVRQAGVMQNKIAKMQQEMADRTDYESESYAQLVERHGQSRRHL